MSEHTTPKTDIGIEDKIGTLPAGAAKQPGTDHVEQVPVSEEDLRDDENDEEPVLHARTWIALAALLLLNMVQVVALSGPPSVLSYICTSLHLTAIQPWIVNALSLVQAVLGPVISNTSDVFQNRKLLLFGTATVSFVGAAVAAGSKEVSRLIVGQTLIGVGFAAVPLAYAVPSEILPRKWRPLAQAAINVAANAGAILAPLSIGAFVRSDPVDGWRNFYWIQVGLWGFSAIAILLGYRPPKRHTAFDHLSFWQKLSRLDLPGFALLTVGLILVLVGLNSGGEPWPWSSAQVLAPLIIGFVTLAAFGVYEWKGTSTGILHHDLFRRGKSQGHLFAICVLLILVESITGTVFTLFFPILTNLLFEQDSFKLVLRSLASSVALIISSVIFGYLSTKFRTIREFLFIGFFILTAAVAAIAGLQPSWNVTSVALYGLAGFGLGPPLMLVVAGVQLATPHRLIATATAVITSTRAVGVSIFAAVFTAAYNNRIKVRVPSYVSAAALRAGLPMSSLVAYLSAFLTPDPVALAKVPGVTPAVTLASGTALRQAYADSVRVVFIIGAPFGVVACVACFFIGSLKSTMNYKVDAPLEEVHAAEKNEHGDT